MNLDELNVNFLNKYQKKAEYVVDTGGRIEIIGNHLDHNHGICVVGNCTLRAYALISLNNTDFIKVSSKGFDDFKLNINNLNNESDDLSSTKGLLKGIIFKFKELGFKVGGFDMLIDSKIPAGSGVSSSAAIESLFGFTISYLFNEGKINPIEIAKTGQYSENNFFGKPCGLLDQIGTSFDSINTIDFKDINNPLIETISFDLDLSLFLIKSIGDHSSLTDKYASIPNSMFKVAKKFEKDF